MDKPIVTNTTLLHDALQGLSQTQKTLEAKYFYDAKGSALFEEITSLPEYYPTRTEIGILRDHANQIASELPPDGVFLELGSGASIKTRILLDAMVSLRTYCPLDISKDFLEQNAEQLRTEYPQLNVVPITADFMTDITLPEALVSRPKLVFFPGSTIGNLSRAEAIDLLTRLRSLPHVSGLILGADMVKPTDILIPAYADASGVTAAFNRNLLVRLNRETGANFIPEQFRHEARWDTDMSCIEMHLVSTKDQQVELGGAVISFDKGESIHTENSHKYTTESLAEMARSSGWQIEQMIQDPAALFSVVVFSAAP
ncbi:dimethylhistidine N-methyltransferase [Amylibacter marinus]|uniref:Dimethylhistidine N-methyltransferase n=1 Tax=Amylibacter marinus TaxID=1475483 RepID=A0ABQ5VVD0_9RHOB|nr:L-histidine N(alpha)-methyltransferase [Amylibacter marinus]GLQ35193.1 dimethylhistidine N-methyltransferase [Amylibacter marinus]